MSGDFAGILSRLSGPFHFFFSNGMPQQAVEKIKQFCRPALWLPRTGAGASVQKSRNGRTGLDGWTRAGIHGCCTMPLLA